MNTKAIVVLLFVAGTAFVLLLVRTGARLQSPNSRDVNRGVRIQIEEARDTCTASAELGHIVALRISETGDLSINSERVKDDALAQRLQDIYGTRPEPVLYLFPERDVTSERLAKIVGVVRNVRRAHSDSFPLPAALRSPSENFLDIQIKLITPKAVNTLCPEGYFNWATQGLPVSP